jgi:thiamine biosynthesis protein ThiS
MVVVEHNGEIVRDRAVFATRPVSSGDRIEIVHFVGGG